MENAIYAALPRQIGLMQEMQLIANNISNSSTTGFRREGLMFAEYIRALEGEPSLSLARPSARHLDMRSGTIEETGGTFDLAISGEGFFMIETPEGPMLSRAGHFTLGAEGELLNPDGYRLLDEGGAPIQVPANAQNVQVAEDGTLSAAGQPIARVGLWEPTDPMSLRHQQGTLFASDDVQPSEEAGRILQGRLEGSNVDPVKEVARMIEVQRIYEFGQSLLDREDQRIRKVIEIIGR